MSTITHSKHPSDETVCPRSPIRNIRPRKPYLAQVDDPLLVIRQWNSADPAGSWHLQNWAPVGVQASVVTRLLGLGASQSPIDPNVFFWRKVVRTLP